MVAERKRRQAAAASTTTSEEVAASELTVGDKIFFPNSRQAQEIGNIFDVEPESVAMDKLRRIESTDGTASWLLPFSFAVKREISSEEE